MTTFMQDILKKLGWEEGFQIPVANVANQELEKEVARLSLLKIRTKNSFDASDVKLTNLQNQLKYVSQESEQNQNLITAHVQQLREEESRLRVNEAERDKFEQEIRLYGKNIDDVKNRVQVKKNQLEKCAVKLEKLKLDTHWDDQALAAWEESLKKRDEDNELIKNFSKEDQRQYNELEAKRQNLEKEYACRKQTIEKMVCDITNYERMLERTGKMMKQQVNERKALIRQWKDSVKILHHRDKAIDRLQMQIIEAQEVVQKQEEKLQEHKQFHQNQIRINEELERESQQLNAINSKIHRELGELSQYIHFINNESDAIRRTMISVSNHLEKERNKRKNIRNEITTKDARIIRLQKDITNLKEKYDELKESTITADEGLKHIEKLIDFEQKLQLTFEKETEVMQYSYFRAQQELQDQITFGKSQEIDILGATTNISHIVKHNEDKIKTLEKQKEDAYELDYKIDEVQRKIMASENVYLGDDKEELEKKIAELENKMLEHGEVKSLLKDQVNKIQDDMRRLTAAISSDRNQLSVLKDKLQHQMLSFEGGQKQLELSKQHFQEVQVEKNILLLRVNQLKKAMRKEEKNINTLQKLRLNLEQATKERLIEIETNREILIVKKRNLSDDNGRLKADIVERRIRLEQFQKKYDIVLQSLGKDEDGETFSVTHFKIKNAQEKFLLQREGDELDNKIKKAEKEIVAMENTLKVVNLTNVAFKQSLGVVDDEGDEMNECKLLEQETLQVNDMLRQNKKDLLKNRQELTEMKTILESMELKKSESDEIAHSLEQEYLSIQQEVIEKETSIKRTEGCIKKMEKKVKKADIEKYNRNLEIKQLRDANKNVMNIIYEMSIKYQEVTPLINRYVQEYDIKLFERRSLYAISTTQSVRSFRSCSSSNSEQEVPSQVHTSKSSSLSNNSRNSAVSKVTLSFTL